MSANPKNDTTPSCVLDRDVLTSKTVKDLDDMGLSIFAPLCGKNRGAFVLDPPDGNTYGCVAFPHSWSKELGLHHVNMTDSNAIKTELQNGNITGAEAVELIDLLLQAVYGSTANVDQDPYGCNLGGLAKLTCDFQSKKSKLSSKGPIRSVTLAGVLVPAPWATGGKRLKLEEAANFYSKKDFEEMKKLGLNTVQIPVPVDAFDSEDEGVKGLLSDLLRHAEGAGLQTIVTLVGSGTKDDIAAAATYATSQSSVLALTLPPMSSSRVSVAREAAPDLTLFVSANEGDLRNLQAADDNVFAALDMPHASTVGDIASSTSEDDRMKLFYHESVACVSRSPIDYATCFKDMPVFIANGFDMSIDNCVMKGSPGFHDYGQCDRFDETMDSGWWHSHRSSFAERQLFAYEQGLGWSFAAWKLYDESDKASSGVIDSPEKLLSFKDVAAAGLMPSLTKENPAQFACLNPPEPDFLLGDDTAAPSSGPPPDCGNGWWNATTEKCDYWIPPTPAPTKPCPHCPKPLTKKALAISAISGGAVALTIGAIALKLFGGKRQGYTALPPY